jgi:hypothetical protein
MVIFRTADGQPGYHQAEELVDAVQFVERLRNSEGVEHTRIFRMEEVEFDFKPYYKVEVPTGGAFTPAPEPVAEPAPEVGGYDAPEVELAPEPVAEAEVEVPAFEAAPEPVAEVPAYEPAPEMPSTFDVSSLPEVPEPLAAPVAAEGLTPVAPLSSIPAPPPPPIDVPSAPEMPWANETAPVAEAPPISVPEPLPEPMLGGVGDTGGSLDPVSPLAPAPVDVAEPEADPVAVGNGQSARRGLFGR